LDNLNIIKRLKQSDKSALNDLFNQYYRRLCRFAFVILRCEQSAEEIVQDVFVRLWEKRESLNHSYSNLQNYLFISVKNASLNQIRFNRVREYTSDIENTQATSKNEFDKDTFLNRLNYAVGKLPDQCRMIYYLKNKEGLTQEEIANYLEITRKTVENQLHIAMTKLREMLYQYKDSFYKEQS
jgi:RNA polymerase sigma-70 factor (ECF subfamily)